MLFTNLHVVAATLLTVLIMVFVKGIRQDNANIWNTAVVACALAYYVRLYVEPASILFYLANAIEYFAPVFFIPCLRVNFQDRPAPVRLEKILFIVMLLLLSASTLLQINGAELPSEVSESISNILLGKTVSDVTSTLGWLIIVQMAFAMLCILAAFSEAARDWNTDLVPQRRNLRRIFVFCGAPVVLVVIVLHASTTFELAPLELAHGLIALITIVCSLLVIGVLVQVDSIVYPRYERIEEKTIVMQAASLEVPAAERIDESNAGHEVLDPDYQEDLQSLLAHMEKHEAFKQMGIKLEDLADQLQIPVYRLRQCINKGLGFRNFNTFLNHYRVKAAEELLTSPESQQSVLDISIESGFKSLSSFNKFFKQQTGKTPSEFRKNPN